ncbi:hypothetical protein P168DRAFT_36554 [Aspergillus campestris IBT 28561]|uniref:Uncharacterized protein n=1 Tax=Aspergillus campestris (strain IBT 28561) TaxID=1392248 RepID=A0A2I1CW77_ASPC2|nr:uncharacterized protein P168DRAFT_36554 [Aspergillus campestris IBT 28561]PKY01875.1 hypothetical protein P168DRAFT_36554 [Aspergillus campestris IBT 28561]
MSSPNDVARLAWNVSRRPATSIMVNCRCLSFGPFISSAIHAPCLCLILVGYVIVFLLLAINQSLVSAGLTPVCLHPALVFPVVFSSLSVVFPAVGRPALSSRGIPRITETPPDPQ